MSSSLKDQEIALSIMAVSARVHVRYKETLSSCLVFSARVYKSQCCIELAGHG